MWRSQFFSGEFTLLIFKYSDYIVYIILKCFRHQSSFGDDLRYSPGGEGGGIVTRGGNLWEFAILVKFDALISKIDVIQGINGIFHLVFMKLASFRCNPTRNVKAVLLGGKSE